MNTYKSAAACRSLAVVGLAVLACFALQASTARASTCSRVSDAYSRAVLADSPIAYYRLDQTAGPTMCDSSTSANNGTYNSTGITYGVSGALSGSADTAVSAAGSAAEVGQSSANPAGLTGNHDFTLEAWFKNGETTTPYTNQWLVGIGGTGGNQQAAVLSLYPNHNSQLGWGPSSCFGVDEYSNNNCWDASTVGINLWDGDWHYLVVTYDHTTNQLTGYVDGQNLGSQSPGGAFFSVTFNIAASPIILGQGCSTSGCYWLPFDGGLDEVAVYGKALTSSQITAHWTASHDVELTVSKAGAGSGKVLSSPAGLSCPATCSHAYSKDTIVTLTATPASGSRFAGWSGGGCSGTGKCRLTLSADRTVRATFVTVPPPNTTITQVHVNSAKRTATFDFTGSGGVGKLHFQCRLDSGAWSACTSPKTYSGLAPGHHTFEVRAVDTRGRADPTPATHTFTI